MKFSSIEELLEHTENIKGKTFRQIDSEHFLEKYDLKTYKGLLGHVVETGFYQYPINSDPKADFDNLGVELKVTGFVRNKNGTIKAKERVSLSKIDYNKIIDEEYEYSKLILKNKKILFIWYEYEKGKDPADFVIHDYQLYDMAGDEEVFKNDFYMIRQKVRDGLAHELSEGDTSYLGACTKARTSQDRTTQPNSPIMAKPRAYSLKNSYMTGILRSLYSNTVASRTEFKTVEEYILSKLRPYIGKTQLEILSEVTGRTYDEKIPKNINKMITDALIGKDKELPEKDDLFAKTNFIIKNLPITKRGKARERMAFRNLRLSEFEEEWDDSDWKAYFEEVTLLVILWREPDSSCRNGYRVLDGVKKISFDDDDLRSFEISYLMVRETILNQDASLLPTPNSFDGQYLVVAPKGQKGDDAYNNFFKKDTTKVTFMLTKEFLNEKLA